MRVAKAVCAHRQAVIGITFYVWAHGHFRRGSSQTDNGVTHERNYSQAITEGRGHHR